MSVLSGALHDAWNALKVDLYIRKAEKKGDISPEEKAVLEAFIDLPFGSDHHLTEFLDENFPDEDSGFHSFLYNLKHYDEDGNLAYRSQPEGYTSARPSSGRYEEIDSFDEWQDKMAQRARKKYPTKADALRAYRKWYGEQILLNQQKEDIYEGSLPSQPKYILEPVSGKPSIWEGIERHASQAFAGMGPVTEEDMAKIATMRRLMRHENKLAKRFYHKADTTHSSLWFQHMVSSLAREQLIGAMTGNYRNYSDRIAQLNYLHRNPDLDTSMWDSPEELSMMDTHKIEETVKKCYLRLFRDTMNAVIDSVFEQGKVYRQAMESLGRREEFPSVLDMEEDTIEEYMAAPDFDETAKRYRVPYKINDQTMDEYLGEPGFEDRLSYKIARFNDHYMQHDRFKREAQRRVDAKERGIENHNEAVERLNELNEGNPDYEPKEIKAAPDERTLRKWYNSEFASIRGRELRRAVTQIAYSAVKNACLRDVSLRAGMGFTTDSFGNEMPNSPMAEWLENQQRGKTDDSKGTDKNLINEFHLGQFDETLNRLYDLVAPLKMGMGNYFSEEEVVSQQNWDGFLHAWDSLSGTQKAIALSFVRDKQGTADNAQRPLIGQLLAMCEAGGSKVARLPFDENGRPYIKTPEEREDGSYTGLGHTSYVDAFVDHIFAQQQKAEERGGAGDRDRHRMFTKSTPEELKKYLKYNDASKDIPKILDYQGNELDIVSVPGVAKRKFDDAGEPELKRHKKGRKAGEPLPDHEQTNLLETLLSNLAKSRSEGETEGGVTPLEYVYAHLYDRMMRGELRPSDMEAEDAKLHKDYGSIGEFHSLDGWLNPENWDSLSKIIKKGWGSQHLNQIPNLDRRVVDRWFKERHALRPMKGNRERTDLDVTQTKAFQDKFGKFVRKVDHSKEDPNEHQCPQCGGSNQFTITNSKGKPIKVVRSKPCLGERKKNGGFKNNCMSMAMVKRVFPDMSEDLQEKWVGCTNPSVRVKDITINADTIKLVQQMRKDHERDTEAIHSAMSRAAHQHDMGLINCPECYDDPAEQSSCQKCGGHGKILNPLALRRDIFGYSGPEYKPNMSSIKKLEAMNSAFARGIAARRREHERHDDLIARGIWPKDTTLRGHEFDRHIFGFETVLHQDGGPLTPENLWSLFESAKAAHRNDNDKVTRRLVRSDIEDNLLRQVEQALESEEERHSYRGHYSVEDFMDSEHTQHLLDILSENPKMDFPLDEVTDHLRGLSAKDDDGHNELLDDGRYVEARCSKCDGNNCNFCGHTGKEAVRRLISSAPPELGLMRYPPEVLMKMPALRNPTRTLSLLDRPDAQVALGTRPCPTCSNGAAPEFWYGDGNNSWLLAPDAALATKFAHSGTKANNFDTIATLITAIEEVEEYKKEYGKGRDVGWRETDVHNALEQIKGALTGQDERDILKEMNRATATPLDFDEFAEQVEGLDWDPEYISNYDPAKKLEDHVCPHCNELHKAGVISKGKMRTIGDELDYTDALREEDEFLEHTFCKNMREAVQNDVAGYGNLDEEDFDMGPIIQRMAKVGDDQLSPEGLRLLHGIDVLAPITEHLTPDALGQLENSYGRDVYLGDGYRVKLPDARKPLPKTLMWRRLNDPTKKSYLSKFNGGNAVKREVEDLQEEHSLFTFLNMLEDDYHLPQSEAHDKRLKDLYAMYVRYPKFAHKNILNFTPPSRLKGGDNDMNKRAQWAKKHLEDEGWATLPNAENEMIRHLRDNFIELAPLLRLEQRYQLFLKGPLNKARTKLDGETPLSKSILDHGMLHGEPGDPDAFIRMDPGSPMDELMGLLRASSVNLSEFGKYGTLDNSQLGWLTPYEHHPSLEYLMSPDHRHIDARTVRAWMDHDEKNLPEAMRMEGKTWEEILGGRMSDKGISHLSFPGLLWEYATGGNHEHTGEGGWPELDDLMERTEEEAGEGIPKHLIHFYLYVMNELKLRADNPEGSKRLMEKSLLQYPREGLNEHGTATRCMVCRGANQGKIPVDHAIHFHARHTKETADSEEEAKPTFINFNGDEEVLPVDDEGKYDFNDANVQQYILTNLAPLGYEAGEESWRKAYENAMNHGDVPLDEDDEEYTFDAWLREQECECPVCQSQCGCATCSGSGLSAKPDTATEHMSRLLQATARMNANQVGLQLVDGRWVHAPETKEAKAPENPLWGPFALFNDRRTEMDMALQDELGISLNDWQALDLSDQRDIIGAFYDELSGYVKGDPDFDEIWQEEPETKESEGKKVEGEDDSDVRFDPQDRTTWPIAMLQAECKKNGLKEGGDAERLIERLEDYDREQADSYTGRYPTGVDGWFDELRWPESERYRILGGMQAHRTRVEGPDYGEDWHETDGEGNYLKVLKDGTKVGPDHEDYHGKDLPWATQTKYGYEATQTRILDGEDPDAISLPMMHNGEIVKIRVPKTGKGYKESAEGRTTEKFRDRLKQYKEKKQEELVKQYLEKHGISKTTSRGSQNLQYARDVGGKKAYDAILRGVETAVRREVEKDGEPKFWHDRVGSYLVPLLIDQRGRLHTLMDREHDWFKEGTGLTEEQQRELDKYKESIRRMKDAGHSTTIEGKQPLVGQYDNYGWDLNNQANGLGRTDTNLHMTSSFVRGRGDKHDTGNGKGTLGLGNKRGWYYKPRSKQRDESLDDHKARLRKKARIPHWGYVDEQYVTPHEMWSGKRHSHFSKIPKASITSKRSEEGGTDAEYAKAMSISLGNRMHQGVSIHNRRSLSKLWNAVHGRRDLKERLIAMAAGNEATKIGSNVISRVGTRQCPACQGSRTLKDNVTVCPTCDGHGEVPHKGVEPIMRYDKANLQFFHKASAGAPAQKGTFETFRDLLAEKLKTVKWKNNRIVEYPASPDFLHMTLMKLKELQDDNFRVLLPHAGWGAQVGHRPWRAKRRRVKGEDGEDDTWETTVVRPSYSGKACLSTGYGDAFLGLHDKKSIVAFVEALNRVMEDDSKWAHHLKEFHRLAHKHLPGHEESHLGTVKTDSDGTERVINPAWGSQEEYEEELLKEINDARKQARKDGHHKKGHGHKDRERYKELNKLRRYLHRYATGEQTERVEGEDGDIPEEYIPTTSNLTEIIKGAKRTASGQYMSVLTPDGQGFDEESGFVESPHDNVWTVPAKEAKALLSRMVAGSPSSSALIPIGHGGDLKASDAERRLYKKNIIGRKTIGIAPDDRFAHMEQLLEQAQEAIMAMRITHQPETFRKMWPDMVQDEKTKQWRVAQKVTPEDITTLCDKLGIPAHAHFPSAQELRGQIGRREIDPVTGKETRLKDIEVSPEGIQNLYRFRMNRLREMAERAYASTPTAAHKATPNSIWDWNVSQRDRAMAQPDLPLETAEQLPAPGAEPPPETTEKSYESPMDYAFSILKNIV